MSSYVDTLSQGWGVPLMDHIIPLSPQGDFAQSSESCHNTSPLAVVISKHVDKVNQTCSGKLDRFVWALTIMCRELP